MKFECATWCCLDGCAGVLDAVCDNPPCDGLLCTCGAKDLRALAYGDAGVQTILSKIWREVHHYDYMETVQVTRRRFMRMNNELSKLPAHVLNRVAPNIATERIVVAPDLFSRETFVAANCTIVNVHPWANCRGYCPIHRPSDHALNNCPLHWDSGAKTFLRECVHGYLHDDPDNVAWKRQNGQVVPPHHCDGCCI